MPHVAVIGAGPAGSIAALVLARGGVDVTLIEQHRFPRDKVCGECLSALGVDVLRRLNLDGALGRLNPIQLRRAILFSDQSEASVPLPRPMWGISRLALDQLLLETARSAGVRIVQPARCEAVEPHLRLRMLESNAIDELDADYIIVADGKGAHVSRSATITDEFGLKAHFDRVDAIKDAIGLFGVHGHYGGIAPIENDRWNVAFSVPGEQIRQCASNLDRLFDRILGESPALSRQLKRARRITDWLISPLPRFAVQSNWPSRVIPVGNAAAALEPIGGEGMGLAMRSAELAARAILDATSRNVEVNYARLREEYRKLWNLRRFIWRAGAMLISSPPLARLGIPLARARQPAQLVLRLVGK